MSSVTPRSFERAAGRESFVFVATLLWVALGAAGLSAQDPQVPFDYDAAIAPSQVDGSYGYFRTIDGSATVLQTDTGDRVRVEVNEPILVGDRVFLAGNSRAEIVLADRNIVRIGDQAEIGFRALAYSGDAPAPTSVIELRRGTLQVVVLPEQLGQTYPRIATPNANVELRETGTYLIIVDDDIHTEVVVRQGRADVLTETDGAEVRQGESLFVEGPRGSRVDFAAAPSIDRLERWGESLGQYARGEYVDYVDGDLAYSASSLSGHGSWVDVGGSYAWRPYVDRGWAPYRHGRWRYTPSGLFWVSYEPWGWVPYHYGYWDHHVSYGWIWYPGRRFATAHVYWYWGPTYAGWIPSGYYARHWGSRYGARFGFHFGVYGSIGGGWGPYRYWSFLPHGRLGHRRQHFYTVGGYDLGRRSARLADGVLLTDTRSLRPDVWNRPNDAIRGLRRAGSRDGRALPDARAFVERSPRLPQALERVTLSGRDSRSAGGVRSADGRAVTRPQARSAETSRPALQRPGADRGAATRGQSAARPTLRRPETGRAAQSSRPTLQRPEAGRAERSSRPTLRRPDADRGATRGDAASRPALRRPETRPAQRSTRPSTPATRTQPGQARPQVDRGAGAAARPTARQPSTSSAARPTLRRPERPVARSGASARPTTRPATSRPAARSGGSAAQRPAVRPSTRTTRPTARPSGGTASRPTLRRPAGGTTSRPAARSSSGSSSRPTVRPSGSSTRPTVRPRSGGTRPTARPSGGSTSRPAVRPSSGSTSRPTVRRSGGSSSRPTARPSSGSSSRPSARPSSSGSRPSASRSSGAGSRSGASRGSGSRSRRGGG